MIGDLLKKIAMETKTLSIVEARCLKYVCNICRNVLVKVQRAQKHLEDAHKEYCTRLQAQKTGLQPPLSCIPQPTPPLPALASLKHARPSFSPSGVSPAAKRPTLLPKSTPVVPSQSVSPSAAKRPILHPKNVPDVPAQFSPTEVSPVAKRPTLWSKVTPNVASDRRSRSILHLRDSADRPTAARSLAFSGASNVTQEVHEVRVYTDLDDDTDEDIKVLLSINNSMNGRANIFIYSILQRWYQQ